MTSLFRFCSIVAVLCLMAAGWILSDSVSVQAAPAADNDDAAQPVESDMHEFMEYAFQPAFKRLKPVMASAPADNAGWKAVKADALVLAEGGNLLLIRQPKDDAADWVSHSVKTRDFGGQLYRAAKAKDYASARKHYEAMVQSCNACHQQFAGGEHILSP